VSHAAPRRVRHTLEAVPRDPEDNDVLECALASRAQFIITGDLDLLSLGTFRGIQIVRAADFIRRWQRGELGEDSAR
jgi:predicted nucleic acid-binding protein